MRDLEAANSCYLRAKEQLTEAKGEVARSVLDLEALKGEMDSRTRSYKADLAESVSDMGMMRAELDAKDKRIRQLERESNTLRDERKVHEESVAAMQRKAVGLEQMLERSQQEASAAEQDKQLLQRDTPRLKKEVGNLACLFKEKSTEYAATLKMFEEQLRISLDDAGVWGSVGLCRVLVCCIIRVS